MQYASSVLDESEIMTAASRLIMGSIDREIRIVTEQKSADGTMANEQNIARLISSQDVFDLADDALLSIDCSALNACMGLCEELVGHHLKLARWQETGRRSVIFVHRLSHFQGDVQFPCNDLGCLDCLALATGDDLRCARKPSGFCQRFGPASPDLT
jgi:hypothetical protein